MVGLPSFRFLDFDPQCTSLLVCIAIEDEHAVDLADHEAVQGLNKQRFRSLIIVFVYFDFKLVPILSSEYLKVMLISPIHNTIALFFAI